MFNPNDILYEDNHLLVVNKRVGDLVQPDKTSDDALENYLKAFLKVRDHKPGDVFLGVVHRIDRPVSGAVLFAKTSKALVRLQRSRVASVTIFCEMAKPIARMPITLRIRMPRRLV